MTSIKLMLVGLLDFTIIIKKKKKKEPPGTEIFNQNAQWVKSTFDVHHTE